jgi:hypothetical protein
MAAYASFSWQAHNAFFIYAIIIVINCDKIISLPCNLLLPTGNNDLVFK